MSKFKTIVYVCIYDAKMAYFSWYISEFISNFKYVTKLSITRCIFVQYKNVFSLLCADRLI